MNKLFSFLLLMLLPLTASAGVVEIDGIKYELSSKGNIAVVSYPNCYTGNLTIPNKVIYENIEYTVTSLSDLAFFGCSGLTSVSIPNSVTSIGSSAFQYCSGLTSVNIPESVTSIEQYAFCGCSGLTSVSIPNSVTSIGNYTFFDCKSLTAVSIPEGVTSIGEKAFSDCIGLTSVSIPNSVTSIGKDAFLGTAWYNTQPDGVVYVGKVVYNYKGKMSQNTSITIKDGTLAIAERAFDGCRNLSSVSLPNSVERIGNSAFSGCSGLTSVSIPNSVTSIGSSAFQYCSGLTSVNIPESVASIEEYAFSSCSGLTSVSIPKSVTSIGNYAFFDCKSLTAVSIPEGVTDIGSGAFFSCSGLTSVSIPNSVTSIGSYAFEGCSGLITIISEIKNPNEIPTSVFPLNSDAILIVPENTTVSYKSSSGWNNFKNIVESGKGGEVGYKIEIDGTYYLIGEDYTVGLMSKPNKDKYSGAIDMIEKVTYNGKVYNVTRIEKNAFYGCSGLKSVNIPESVTSIEEYAFSGCSGLTSVSIPKSVTSIGSYAFEGCSGLITVSISEGVTSMGVRAFSGCSGLTSLNIPSSLTRIRGYAFYGCSGLKSVNIPEGITSIEEYAFYGCGGLTTVCIPNSVTSIREYAFYNNLISNNLISVIIGSGVSTINKNAFNVKDLKKTIWLTNTPPSGYEYASGAVNYVSNDQFSFSNKVKYQFLSSYFEVEGVRYVPISPSEKTCDAIECLYNDSSAKIKITSIVEYKGVTMTVKSIKPYFAYKNRYIQSLTIDYDGGIPDHAFQGCWYLKNIILGQKISSIGNSSFNNCYYLETIDIPDAVTDIGDYAFSDCNRLVSVNMGKCGGTIMSFAFQGCPLLKEMVIGTKVKGIKDNAFEDCKALSTITIPGSVTSIGNSVFSGCSELKNVIINDSEETLSMGSNGSYPLFSSCPLDYVYIGRDISYRNESKYGYSPFYRNNSLRAVKFADDETDISDNEFYGCTNLQRVAIGDGVTSIGKWAFSGCQSLKYFAFGSQVENIGQEAFSDCVDIIEIISKAEKAPVCGSQALDDINKWECTLYVPEGCMATYEAADQWKDFIFKEEGNGPLSRGDTLEIDGIRYNINLDTNTAEVTKSESSAYSGNIVLPIYIANEDNSYMVTSISESAFEGCSEVNVITIPSSVISIGDYAFRGCVNLSTIHIGEGVKEIGAYAFANVFNSANTRAEEGERLEVYCYAEEVPNTSDDAFDGTPTESSILHVPASAVEAYKAAWPWSDFMEIVPISNEPLADNGILFSVKDDGSLEVIGLEDGTTNVDILSTVNIDGKDYEVTSIGKRAFEGKDNIEYLSIPSSVTYIGEFAFVDCGNNLTVNIADPESWCQMELGNEHSSPLSSAGKVLVHDIETDKIEIPQGVTSIGNYTFYQCQCIKSLTIPATVKAIGSSAFEDCTALTSLTLSEGLETIGGSAFQGCTGLTTLSIPSTVKTININGFSDCKGITDVYCYAESVPTTDENAFDGTPTEKSTLHVPADAIEAYKAAWPWSDFKEIVALNGDDPDGIMAVKLTDSSSFYYDLNGRKTDQPRKGIYIRNGKKFVVK